jgi:hypothetical protein
MNVKGFYLINICPLGEIGKHKRLKISRLGLPVQVRQRAPNQKGIACRNIILLLLEMMKMCQFCYFILIVVIKLDLLYRLRFHAKNVIG